MKIKVSLIFNLLWLLIKNILAQNWTINPNNGSVMILDEAVNLDMVVSMTYPGLFMPDNYYPGVYLNNFTDPETYFSTLDFKTLQLTDYFLSQSDIPLTQKRITDQGLNLAQTFIKNITSTYNKWNFLSQNLNQSVFLTLDGPYALYTNEIMKYYFSSNTSGVFRNSTYNLEMFDNNTIFRTLSGDSPRYYTFNYTDTIAKFGFYFLDCERNRSWKNFSLTNETVMKIFNEEFKDVIDLWTRNFMSGRYGNFFIDIYNQNLLFQVNNETLTSNLTFYKIIIDKLIFNYERGDTASVQDFIPQKGIDHLKELRNFINYQSDTFSMFYVNLQVSPMITFIIDRLNNRIRNNSTYAENNIKFINIVVNRDTMISFNKLFAYEINADRSQYYKKLPYIDYGQTYTFELYKTLSTPVKYYVAIRDNFNSEPYQVLASKDYGKYLMDFIISPEIVRSERIFYCTPYF